MKRTLYLISFLFLVTSSYAQSFGTLSFKKLDGDSVWLSAFAGKKVLFVVAPLSTTDPVYNQLQAFKNRYKDTVQLIGVVSFEDGYQAPDSAVVRALYSNMGMVLTEGMYTRKSSANQSPLMQWLTDKNKNLHFNMDVKGVGHKFFVDGSGRLFGVMPPQVALSAAIINRIVHASKP